MSKTKRIAIGGVFSAVSIMMLYLSLFMPLTYFWVWMSGFVLIVVVIEAGRKVALHSYIVISILSFALIPNIARTIVFITFIGYYPIIKIQIDNINRTWLRRTVKMGLFVTCAVIVLTSSFLILGLNSVIADSQDFIFFVFLATGQSVLYYMAYDYLLGFLLKYYIEKLRPFIKL